MPLGNRIFSEFRRPARELIERLAAHPTPDIADAMLKAGALDGDLRPVWRPMPRFAGPALTVSLPVGSWLHKMMAFEMAQKGDVVVLASHGATHLVQMGGHQATALAARGVAGVIVDGCVRDPGEMEACRLPVLALGLHVNSGVRIGPAEINVPVAVGHCVIFPGDIMVADEDGAVVVPAAFAEEVAAKLEKAEKMWAELTPIYQRGEFPKIEGVRNDLQSAGVEFITGLWKAPGQ